MQLAIRLAIHVAAAPTTPARIAITRETVVDQAEERGRVSLHDEFEMRVMLAQRSLPADVGLQPLVGDRAAVGAGAIAVVDVAADPRPGGRAVFLAVRVAGFDDIEEA